MRMNVQHVVVIGGGVAGRAFAVAASRFPFLRVTIVDPAMQPVFEDLLIDVAAPERHTLPSALLPQVDWQKGVCAGIDLAAREVMLEHKRIPFDFVVLATGARPSFARVLSARSAAISPWRRDGRARIATAIQAGQELVGRGARAAVAVVVVGGGRVGIAAAARVMDYARRIHASVAVTVVEQHVRLLTDLPHAAAQLAEQALMQQDIRVRCGARVEAISAAQIRFADATEIPCDVCVWAADHEPVTIPIRNRMGDAGMVGGHTNSRLQQRGYAEIYALGDVAAPPVPHRGPTQGFIFEEALYVSEAIALATQNKQAPQFSLRHSLEEMVYVGGGRAVSVEAQGCRLRAL